MSHYSGFLPRLGIPYVHSRGASDGKECFGFTIGCLGRDPQCVCTVREGAELSAVYKGHTVHKQAHLAKGWICC